MKPLAVGLFDWKLLSPARVTMFVTVSCSWTGEDTGEEALSPTQGISPGKFNFYHKLSLFLLFFAPLSGRVDSTSCL